MQLKTTSRPLFFELSIPIKLIDFSTDVCIATTANFERNMEIGKATTTTVATAWFRYIKRRRKNDNTFQFLFFQKLSKLWFLYLIHIMTEIFNTFAESFSFVN